jgi:hypothetical protein
MLLSRIIFLTRAEFGPVPPEKYIRSPDGELPALGNRLQEHRREIN